jgi:23S rRNA (uridine2552-2'-O)-methyltransferase
MVRAKRKRGKREWIARHLDDAYVKRARKEGYRSRAAFKLEEIDRRDHLLQGGMRVVDLGAAPGGWCQYASKRVGSGGKIVAVDLLPMEPVAGVEFLRGDFTEPSVVERVRECLGDDPVDLVISDMAPNISGIASADQAKSIGLAESVLAFAREILKPDGCMLVKVFQGAGFDAFRQEMGRGFKRLLVRKPEASRSRSREVYLLGTGFKGGQT